MRVARWQHRHFYHNQYSHNRPNCHRYERDIIVLVLLTLCFLVGNDDYLPPTETITFLGSGPQEACIQISIVDDGILEDIESFRVMIVPSVGRGVILNPETADILIAGEESEYCSLQ